MNLAYPIPISALSCYLPFSEKEEKGQAWKIRRKQFATTKVCYTKRIIFFQIFSKSQIWNNLVSILKNETKTRQGKKISKLTIWNQFATSVVLGCLKEKTNFQIENLEQTLFYVFFFTFSSSSPYPVLSCVAKRRRIGKGTRIKSSV